MIGIELAYEAVSEIYLWFKIKSLEDLTLADIPKLIKSRWHFFRDNWESIRQDYIKLMPTYGNPALLQKHINDFSEYVFSHKTVKGNPFSDSDVLFKFFAIFDNTKIDAIPLTQDEQAMISKDISTVSAYTRSVFLDKRALIASERDNIFDRIGLTDADYNDVYGRAPIDEQISSNSKDLNICAHFQRAITSIDFILANIYSLDAQGIDPYAVARQNTNNVDVSIGSYRSGNLRRFNYGETLSDIAARELGSPDKWMDIAIANGLKPPYIDEVGEKIPLLSNASGNQINIAATTGQTLNKDRLFVNQIVLLKSNIHPFPEQRVITNIREAPVSGELVIEVDGDNNLSKYKVNEGAYIRVFKPNTISSSFLIMIPSNDALADVTAGETPWFLRKSSAAEKRQQVDLLLDDSGDIVFNSAGDLQLSYGLNNAIQALKLKLSVELNELERHPNFGIASTSGQINNGIQGIKDLLVANIERIIQADDRFDRIDSLVIDFVNGVTQDEANYLKIKLSVRLAGSEQVVPLTFNVSI